MIACPAFTRVSDEQAQPEDAKRLSLQGASAVGEAETPDPTPDGAYADRGRAGSDVTPAAGLAAPPCPTDEEV